VTLDQYRVVQASTSHWPALEVLLRSVDLSADGAQAHLGEFLLVYEGDTLVGSVGAERYGSVTLVRSLAVRPDRQGRGLGRAVLAKALDAARARGDRAVYLLTTGASGFFERLGFVRLARAEAPPAMLVSTQFRGACPDSALLMMHALASGASVVDIDRLPVAVLGVIGNPMLPSCGNRVFPTHD